MQKTKLILKAKAHGAYNKAKKVYNKAVQSYSGDGNGRRQSDRLRDEREVLRVYVEFFEALKKAVRATALDRPKRVENLMLLGGLLSKNAPVLGETQPSLAFLLDAVSAMVDGLQESVNATSETLEHLIPTCLDGFLSIGYGEAKNVLAQFDRASKALSDGELKLVSLRNQAKPDLALVGQQEQLVHQL
jgi:hypothetical protein